MEMTVVLPERQMDRLSSLLVDLTEAIDAFDPEKVAHGLLGGQHGYGGHWNSDLFQMRPFCWCEGDDCPWCAGCTCPEGSIHYLVDGVEVGYDGWMGFYNREVYEKATGGKAKDFSSWLKLPMARREVFSKRLDALGDAANLRRSTRHDKTCDFCLGKQHADKGAIAGKSAPNFWHKPSGLRVWWYKYIGRSQEVEGYAGQDINAIVADCIAEVGASRAT